MDVRVLQLNDLVVDVTDMLRRTLGEQIMLSTSLARDVWATRTDPGQFQSAIVNMAVNARDAMPHGGKLVIETRNMMLDGHHADFQELRPGEYVQLSISDTGAGIPPEVRDRVFEPFFTTKEKERGTGLGLAMVYGFVKQCGGHVTIYSEVGHGTTINLYFPSANGASGAPVSDLIKGTTDPHACETILVVEDDERVRQLTIARLKMIGYQVLVASDGPKALDILSRGDTIDLVFTDLLMPGGLSGREVATRARELKPGIKVLLTSGYAEELVHGDDLQREQLTILRKPYQQADLVAALREVLDGNAGQPQA
jgi:CheY-like chemotaxis protein